MKSRPILFSAPMVLAILDDRKTQTRRAVKKTDSGRVKAVGSQMNWHLADPNAVLACPYGQPGDQLWVRETWQSVKPFGHGYVLADPAEKDVEIHYRATADTCVPEMPWKPSIFMPRHASRITLEITSIRVERLQEIRESDAWEEGCHQTGFIPTYNDPDNNAGAPDYRSAKDNYQILWESINGPDSWDANPWVWAIEFKRLTP